MRNEKKINEEGECVSWGRMNTSSSAFTRWHSTIENKIGLCVGGWSEMGSTTVCLTRNLSLPSPSLFLPIISFQRMSSLLIHSIVTSHLFIKSPSSLSFTILHSLSTMRTLLILISLSTVSLASYASAPSYSPPAQSYSPPSFSPGTHLSSYINSLLSTFRNSS